MAVWSPSCWEETSLFWSHLPPRDRPSDDPSSVEVTGFPQAELWDRRIKSGPVLHPEAAEFLYRRDEWNISLSSEASGGRLHTVLSVNQFLLIGFCRLSSWSILRPMTLRLIAVLMVIVILSEIEDEINGKGIGPIVMCSQGLTPKRGSEVSCWERARLVLESGLTKLPQKDALFWKFSSRVLRATFYEVGPFCSVLYFIWPRTLNSSRAVGCTSAWFERDGTEQ